MPSLLSRRSSHNGSFHASALKDALAEKDGGSGRQDSVRTSKSLLPGALGGGAKGDTAQIVSIVDDPGNDEGLSSFLPKSLTCLNKFLPSIQHTKGPEMQTLLGVANRASDEFGDYHPPSRAYTLRVSS